MNKLFDLGPASHIICFLGEHLTILFSGLSRNFYLVVKEFGKEILKDEDRAAQPVGAREPFELVRLANPLHKIFDAVDDYRYMGFGVGIKFGLCSGYRATRRFVVILSSPELDVAGWILLEVVAPGGNVLSTEVKHIKLTTESLTLTHLRADLSELGTTTVVKPELAV